MIPDTGFPRVGGMAKEGHRKDNSIMVQNSSISYNTQAFGPRVIVLAVFLRSMLFQSASVMTHKYRGSIVVLSISKSVEPNEEQKEMTSGFQ